MNQKMPYYMAYPMPLTFDDEKTERRDLEYFKSIYPELPKRILPYVEEECDRQEYDNSMIFDQYPDKLQMKLMCRRVYDNIKKYERLCCPEPEDIRNGRRRKEDGNFPGASAENPSLRDLIEVMVYQEVYKRRSDHRRRCRRIY